MTAETTSSSASTEVTPASPAETAATSDAASTTEVAQPLVKHYPCYNDHDQATRLTDSTIYLSEKSTIDDKVKKSSRRWQDQLDLRQ